MHSAAHSTPTWPRISKSLMGLPSSGRLYNNSLSKKSIPIDWQTDRQTDGDRARERERELRGDEISRIWPLWQNLQVCTAYQRKLRRAQTLRLREKIFVGVRHQSLSICGLEQWRNSQGCMWTWEHCDSDEYSKRTEEGTQCLASTMENCGLTEENNKEEKQDREGYNVKTTRV